MNSKDAIFARKSTRKFDMASLDNEIMENIKAFLKNIKPLYEDIKIEYEITTSKNGSVKAPHYLAIFSENKDNYLINAGFIFQQFSLYLTEIGIGSCWVGFGKPDIEKTNLNYIIMIAFGKAIDSPFRDLNEFNRKSLHEISDIPDERLEVARLAPSSMNSQPWRFICDENIIHVYCVKLGVIKNILFKKFHKIDIGIVLCHLYIANKENFNVRVLSEPKEIKGYSYICSLDLSKQSKKTPHL